MRLFKLLCDRLPLPKSLFRTGHGRQSVIAAAVVLVMGTFVTPARADIVTATFSNVNPGEVVTITGVGSGWAGFYNFTNASGALTGNYSGFCIDINQEIFGGLTTTWTVANLQNAPTPGTQMGQLRANLIGELWQNDRSAAALSNSNAAAFQIAIWEIINETSTVNGHLDLNVSTGNFTITANDAATITTANLWLSQIDITGNGPQAANLKALTSLVYQDYVVQFPSQSLPAPVPAPSGLILGLTGMVGLSVPTLWRKRNLVAACA